MPANEDSNMKHQSIIKPANNTTHVELTPSQKQIDTLAHRLMPEIKKYFADERIQKEFEQWKEKKKVA